MFDKEMKSGDHSNVVSNHGSNNTTIINNIDEKMISHIVKSMLYENMPSFQNEAKKEVIASIDDYLRSFIYELDFQKTDTSTLSRKLSTPDIQYSLYETAKRFARSPERTEKTTLINLVVKKINEMDGDSEELTAIDLAIDVATKLSVKQIRYISLIYFASNLVKLSTLPSGAYQVIDPANPSTKDNEDTFYFPNGIEIDKSVVHEMYIDLYKNQINDVFHDDEIDKIDYSMLISLGCITQQAFPSSVFIEKIKKRTGVDLNNPDQKETLKPLIDKINKVTSIENIDYQSISTIGRQIANAYVSTRMRLIDPQKIIA